MTEKLQVREVTPVSRAEGNRNEFKRQNSTEKNTVSVAPISSHSPDKATGGCASAKQGSKPGKSRTLDPESRASKSGESQHSQEGREVPGMGTLPRRETQLGGGRGPGGRKERLRGGQGRAKTHWS